MEAEADGPGAHGVLAHKWSVASSAAHLAGVRGLDKKLGSRVGHSNVSSRAASSQ